jgi:hypothetical protein
MNGFVELCVIARTKIFGGENICTDRKPDKKIYEKVDEGGSRSHRREGIIAREASDHHNIGSIK